MQKFIKLLKDKLLDINVKPKRCKRCFMDETAEGISFGGDGCNYCDNFLVALRSPSKKIDLNLSDLVLKIKKDGSGKRYDCIVGLSGGVDSSYTIVKVKELGLRPLAVHMDNGWNSESAASNIKNLVEKLEVDLFTHVIDWQEYRDLMNAFFKADVIDIELLYDNAMIAVNYQLANKYNIKYILSGSNTSTEGVSMPVNWNWGKRDKRNIKSIARLNNVKIKTFPLFGTLDFVYYEKIRKLLWIGFLDYLESFDKYEALKVLQKDFGYKPYPYKHYESIFTRFYQGFILPVKFNVDKRKVHLSSLVLSGQLEKKEALGQLLEIPYPSEEDLLSDIEYFLKKMQWDECKLTDYLKRPEKSHEEYGSEKKLWEFLSSMHEKYLNIHSVK